MSTYTYGGGYTCATCRAYVPYWVTHNCPGWQPATGGNVKWDRMTDVRIADALERIAAALESLVSNQDTDPASEPS